MWEADRKPGNTQRQQLTGTHRPYCEEGMIEETRIIFLRESKFREGGNASCSELQCLNRPASCGLTGKALMTSGRCGVSRFWLWSSRNFQQCSQMDSAATAGTEFLDMVIVFEKFAWRFAVGLCSGEVVESTLLDLFIPKFLSTC